MRGFALLLFAVAAWAQTAHQQHHPPQSAAGYVKHLESPERAAWQKPHEVVTALALRPDEVVADIGAGPGYFTRRIARHVAKVYAVDIDAELLTKAKDSSPGNVETIHATPDDPKLPAASVDTIFICDVLHHIENRPAYYAKLAAALKPGGRIVNIDFFKKKLPIGPPVGMKLTEQQVTDELAAAGFHKTAKHDFLPYQYFLEFRTK